jgi:hypothetical protein
MRKRINMAFKPLDADAKASLTPFISLWVRFCYFFSWLMSEDYALGAGVWSYGYTYCEDCKMYAPKKIDRDEAPGMVRDNPAAHENYLSDKWGYCIEEKARRKRRERRQRAEAAAREAAAKKAEKAAKRRAAVKRRKVFLSSEKERKSAAFNNRIFQPGFRSPSMSKKELAWNETGGKCKLCRSYSIARELGFWWRIYPTLEVVLLCRNCAEKEGLSVDHNEETVKSRRISEEIRDSVWNRDEGKCVQCGSNENLEFDHIIPFSRGGANTKRNIQLLCESCNRAKSDNIG